MYINKDDKNIFLMIAIILVVSIFALIAIANIVWRVIAAPLNTVLSQVGQTVNVNRLDYNFPVPAKVSPAPQTTADNPQPVPAEPQLNYNFVVSSNSSVTMANNQLEFDENVITDAAFAQFNSTKNSFDGTAQIMIPKVQINAQIFQDSNYKTNLQQGFQLYPTSNKLNEGEVVIICLRKYLASTDPRGCSSINKLNIEDEIYIQNNGQTVKYQVVGINQTDLDPAIIYNNLSKKEAFIKIVTSGESSTQRLVILAKKA